MAVKFVVSLIPVFLFLVMLLYSDSMKLVKNTLILFCLGWGVLISGLSYLLNTFLYRHFQLSNADYSVFMAPVVEEILKFSLLLWLVRKNRIGFMIDGAVYGFTIGAGFSFIENIFYLFMYGNDDPWLSDWIVRGFGTAIMHGGATALMAILCMGAINRQSKLLSATLLGGAAAIVIHALFNLFLVTPLVSAAFIVGTAPLSLIILFKRNENSIRNWLELEFDSEVKMLSMIRKGKFSHTKTGNYLVSVKTHFQPEMVVDLYCYISLYLELSLKAKRQLMLNEAGIAVAADNTLTQKLAELKELRKLIGTAGYLAIAPVLKMTRKDLWKLSLLNNP